MAIGERKTMTRVCWLILLVCFGWASAPAQPPAQTQDASKQDAAKKDSPFSTAVPVKEGDRCIICGTPLQPHDKVYLVEGQRVGVMSQMEPTLLSDPWAYLARLKPRGGLFGGETVREGRVSNVYLLAGLYLTVGLAFAAICAHRALNVGGRPVPWFFAGLAFNAFGYLALLMRSKGEADGAPAAPAHRGVVKIPATAEPAACPTCGGLNHPSATECSSCGAALTPEAVSEVALAAAVERNGQASSDTTGSGEPNTP